MITLPVIRTGDVVLGRTPDELAQLAAADGQPAYRGKQLMDGVLNGARSIDDIGNVSSVALVLRASRLQPPAGVAVVCRSRS